MVYFAIIGVADGLMVVEVQPHQRPEDAALKNGGVLVDPGPYRSYEAASNALAELEADDDE